MKAPAPISSAAGALASLRRFPPLGADPARATPSNWPGQRPALPPAARRGDRTTRAAESPALTALADRLAEAALPGSDRRYSSPTATPRPSRSACSWPAPDIPLERRPRPGRKQLGKTNSLIGGRPAPAHGRRRQPGDPEDVARHADPRARRRGLGNDQQGRPRRLALLLRGLPGGLRQRAAKLTGSYYTPPEVVAPMVRLVDEVAARASRFGAAVAWPRRR